MKNLGIILIGGVTVPILLLVGFYILRPSGVPPQSRLVISIEEDIARVEESLAQKRAPIQDNLDTLNSELTQQQTDFNTQVETWHIELTRLQNQLDMLDTTAQKLKTEGATLEISRTIRLEDYQNQLEQARQQYQTELGQYQAELNRKQALLDELNAELVEREQ